jgi:hypothetical protein
VSYFFGQELQGHEPAKAGVLGLVHNPHAAATELFNDAVVRDGLADHAQACYGGSVSKSMKAVELAMISKGCWRKIAITLTTQGEAAWGRSYSQVVGHRLCDSRAFKDLRPPPSFWL